MDDSDDYELLPRKEVDELKREMSSIKKNSLVEGDKAKILVDSMEKLTLSINRLITILDDAQKDIIDEYQEAKPAEKLNKLLEQNEMIAKALIAISDKINSQNVSQQSPTSRPNSQMQQNFSQGLNQMPFQMNDQGFGSSQMPKEQVNIIPKPLPPLDDLPPIGPMGSSMNDMPRPDAQKKKFLGFM